MPLGKPGAGVGLEKGQNLVLGASSQSMGIPSWAVVGDVSNQRVLAWGPGQVVLIPAAQLISCDLGQVMSPL